MIDIDLHRLDQIYLGIDAPYPDETFSSVLNRAACLYGMSPRDLLVHLLKDQKKALHHGVIDVADDPSFQIRHTVKSAFAHPYIADPVVIDESDSNYLDVSQRKCYCVICFWEDVVAGRTPYFRSAWAKITKTYCDVHKCPLVAENFGSSTDEWWKHPWCIAATVRTRPKAPIYDDLRKKAKEFENYSLDVDSDWPGKALSARLYEWELNFSQSDADWYICKLLLWLACFPPTEEGTIPRRWKDVRQMAPRMAGWNIGALSEHRSPEPGPQFLNWNRFRWIGSPEQRRALFLLAACSFEKGVPIQDLGVWPKHVESATESWWHWIIWHRLGEWNGEMAWLHRMGQLANCNFSTLREAVFLSQMSI